MAESRAGKPPTKKRKTVNPAHQACAACKSRKVRCDAARPRCAACASSDKPCEYPPVYKRATCSQQHVQELEAKLQEYERRMAVGKLASASADGTRLANDHGTYDASRSGDMYHAGVSAAGTSSIAVASAAVPDQHPVDHEDSGPLMGTLTANHRETMLSTLPEKQPKPTSEQEQSDDDNLNFSGSSTPGLDSINEEDQDDDEHSVIDGIAQYSQASPKGSNAVDTFGESSTFNFALAMAASKGPARTAEHDRHDRSPPAQQNKAHVQSGRPGFSVTAPSYFGLGEGQRQNDDDEMMAALKSYVTQSSLQYLPQRHAASKLLQKYFTDVHTIWPFLIEKDTRALFDETFTSDDASNPVWTAQLNLIFALACQFYDSKEVAPLPDIHEAGRQFYLRASGFVVANSHRRCSIPILQTLLLAAQYQQGTMRSDECWLAIGIATRMALGLGLHELGTAEFPLSLEEELRKRLWWGCFALDRVSSMVYGRPVGIPHMGHPANNSDFPSLVDDKFIAIGESQPPEVPSVNAFFSCVIKLYHTMDEILNSLNDGSKTRRAGTRTPMGPRQQQPSPSSFSQLTAILRLDALLCRWHKELPSHLKFSLVGVDDLDSLPAIFQRQQVILKMRFLGLRILLHRQSILFLLQTKQPRTWPRSASRKWPPLFSDTCSPTAEEEGVTMDHEHPPAIESQLARLSANICVAMAGRQIEIIDASRPKRLSGAWWWDLHFTFNSLCVLFGALGASKEDFSAIVPDINEAKTLIRRGFHNIREMVMRGGPKVAHSERFLRSLLKTMTRRARKHHGQDNEALSGFQRFVSPPMHEDIQVDPASQRAFGGLPPGVHFDDAPNNFDPGFLDAFDFLMADHTSSFWPGTEPMMSRSGGATNFELGTPLSLGHPPFDTIHTAGRPMYPS